MEVTLGLCAHQLLEINKVEDFVLVSCLGTRTDGVCDSNFQVLPGGFHCLDAQKNTKNAEVHRDGGHQRWALLGGEFMKSPGRMQRSNEDLCRDKGWPTNNSYL